MITATSNPAKRWVSRRRAMSKRRRPGRVHGVDLDRIAAAQPSDAFLFFGPAGVVGVSPLEVAAGVVPCPVCGSTPGDPGFVDARGYVPRYCIHCDATGADLYVDWPGLDVDAVPDPDYPVRGRAYDPPPGLAGGVGGSASDLKRRARS